MLSLSADNATTGRGLLAFLFSAGLGIPFVLVAASPHRAMDRPAVVRCHPVLVMRFGGVLLIAIGLLRISGVWAG